MPDWFGDLAISFAGAFLGVLGGLQASRWLNGRQTNARRAALINTLRAQLSLLPREPGDYERSAHQNLKRIPASALSTSAITHLLSGDVLDAKMDAELIKQLVLLGAWLGDYVEAARLANAGSTQTQNYWVSVLSVASKGLAASRNMTLKQLPKGL